MSDKKNIFLVEDNDESLKGKASGGKFGLNTGFISKLEFVTDAGKGKTPGFAIDLWLRPEGTERDYRSRLFDATGQNLYNKKGVLVSPGQETYEETFADSMTIVFAVVRHALKAVGVSAQNINNVASTLNIDDIDGAMKSFVSLVPSNYDKVKVDFFLEYQFKIADGQDKTYPELPKNMKGGAFLLPTVTGSFTEVRDADGLRYVDTAGNSHPFTRDARYMDSEKGKQQNKASGNKANPFGGTSPAATANAAAW